MAYPQPPQYYAPRPPAYRPGNYAPAPSARGGQGGGSGGGGLGSGLGTAYSTWKTIDPFLPKEYQSAQVLGNVFDSISNYFSPAVGGMTGVGSTLAGLPGSGYASVGDMLAASQGGMFSPVGSTLSNTQSIGSYGAGTGGGSSAASGATSTLGTAAQAAGALLAAYNLADMYRNRPSSRTGGAVSGLTSGATIGGVVGGPVGAGIGAVLGAGYGLAMKPKRTDLEQKRLRGLHAGGYKYITNDMMKDTKDSGFRGDLGEDFVGYDSSGKYVNNRFARSRKESDLTPETILKSSQGVGQAGFAKEFGNAWMERLNEAQRSELVGEALKRNLVSERYGSTFLAPDQELQRKALYMMNGIKA